MKLADVLAKHRKQINLCKSITRFNLRGLVDVAVIEKKETVFDPMGYAPELPFGFRNQAWGIFLKEAKKKPIFRFQILNRFGEGGWQTEGYCHMGWFRAQDAFVTRHFYVKFEQSDA